MFLLFITHPTGYVQVVTFATRFERAIDMIALRLEPVTLRTADY